MQGTVGALTDATIPTISDRKVGMVRSVWTMLRKIDKHRQVSRQGESSPHQTQNSEDTSATESTDVPTSYGNKCQALDSTDFKSKLETYVRADVTTNYGSLVCKVRDKRVGNYLESVPVLKVDILLNFDETTSCYKLPEEKKLANACGQIGAWWRNYKRTLTGDLDCCVDITVCKREAQDFLEYQEKQWTEENEAAVCELERGERPDTGPFHNGIRQVLSQD